MKDYNGPVVAREEVGPGMLGRTGSRPPPFLCLPLSARESEPASRPNSKFHKVVLRYNSVKSRSTEGQCGLRAGCCGFRLGPVLCDRLTLPRLLANPA